MSGYYEDKLAAERLRRVYELASPRVRRYLDAEVDYVLARLEADDIVLELGCGYGRVLGPIAEHVRLAVGVDSSFANLALGRDYLPAAANVRLAAANAVRLGLRENLFDAVVCVQNGISAFHVDPGELVAEALRVARPGGALIFSSYADAFWEERLAWFEAQAAEGLLGEIDRERTGDGVIVCRDGFTAATFRAEDFRALATSLGAHARVEEVDGSSLICEMRKGY